MIEIEKPKIECVEDPANGTYGKFTVEPLERGYGITLGNALRRIMLSSLPGTAATSIKIAGVQHEFSTIPGVKEDVTEIVLNVKSLITRLHNTDGIKTVYIEAVGPCEVKAGDIKGDSEVEVLNPLRGAPSTCAGCTVLPSTATLCPFCSSFHCCTGTPSARACSGENLPARGSSSR